MWAGIVMIALSIGSSAGAFLHYRASRHGEAPLYPLFYDLLGAVVLLAYGAGTCLRLQFFTGSGRWWLLLLIPAAAVKWRGVLRGR